MFTDGRSRRVVFLAHCLLNQNAISDGTAEVPAAHREILRTVLDARVGVVQLPCPELCCLGLDRGDPKGGERPVVAENTRIRRAMGQPEASARLRELTDQVVWQIREYQKHGFAVLGIVGVDRSPCCGVNTTSDQDRELPGRGVFIASLRAALESAGLTVPASSRRRRRRWTGYGPFWGNEVCDGDSTHTGWRASGGHGPVLAGVP